MTDFYNTLYTDIITIIKIYLSGEGHAIQKTFTVYNN